MTAALLHLHNRTRPPTPDVPTVVFSAAAPCGCEVIWRAMMPDAAVPDECANPLCKPSQSHLLRGTITGVVSAPRTVLVTPPGRLASPHPHYGRS